MRTVLVTGATGFIGAHVARVLLQRGYAVRALVRTGSIPASDLNDVAVLAGDVRDRAAVEAAVEECDAVIHAAALYSFSPKLTGTLYEVNVGGTRNVIDAAVQAGVERVVYTSTVGTLSFRDRRTATEADFAEPSEMTGHYKRSKFEAERMVRRMASRGAPVVIVNPTFPVGPGDTKPTPTGHTIVGFLRGKLPATVDTGFNVVDVADVAEGHVLAMERGTVGERYVLGNAAGNLTLVDLLERLARITGLHAPRWRMPHAIATLAAHIDGVLEGKLLGREPRIPLEGARTARTRAWVDPAKAIHELGLPQRPIDQALAQAVHWFIEKGYARPPASRAGASAE